MIPPVVTPKLGGYARLPREVLADSRLKHRDVCVYAVIASEVWQGNYACVGQRLISGAVHSSPRRVAESIARLERFGHVRRTVEPRGKRGGYVLLSEVFGSKQRAGVQEVISRPRKRLASVRVA